MVFLLLCMLLFTGCASPPTAESALDSLAARIQEQYSIEIPLGEDAARAEPWDYQLTPEEDEIVFSDRLQTLEQQLKNYPAGMLKEISRDCGGLRICLVKEITGREENRGLRSAGGLQWRDSDGFCRIAIAHTQEYTLYHELCHMIEDFLAPRSSAWEGWEKLNPPDFQYDYDYAKNRDRDGSLWLQPRNRAFIDTYSMSFPREDRARIMEYAMTEGNKDLFTSPIMQEKLTLLSLGIREVFGLTDSSRVFVWDQYLEK